MLQSQGKQSERGDTAKANEAAAAPAKADAGIIAELEAQVAVQGNKVWYQHVRQQLQFYLQCGRCER